MLLEAEIFVFACQDAVVKLLSEAYPVWEVVLIRSVLSCALLVALIVFADGWGEIKTRHLAGNVLRASLMFISHLFYFTSIASLPLATAVAINFSAPLFVTALSVVLLGERVGLHRWGAVVAGFLGVLIMVRPFAGSVEPGAILAVCGAFTYSLVIIATRRLTAYESGQRVALYSMFFFGIYAALGGFVVALLDLPVGEHPASQYLLRDWSMPNVPAATLLVMIGVIAAFGNLLFVLAYQRAPASLLAPFEYSALILSGVIGYLVWGDVPDRWTVLGAVVVVLSGVYIAHREVWRGSGEVRRRQGEARRRREGPA